MGKTGEKPKKLSTMAEGIGEAKAPHPTSQHVFLRGVTGEAHPATHTVDVHLEGDRIERAAILSQTHDSDMRGGEVFLPKPGSGVILSYDQTGSPFILGYLKDASASGAPVSSSTGDTMASTSIPMADPNTGGAADPLYKLGGTDSHKEGDPGDAGPGDWFLRGTEGNGLGVLEGGVNIFKAGNLSQILGFKLGDLIRIIAKNFELFTGMGELKLVTENNKSRLEFKGSTNYEDGHPSKEKWNIEAGLGGDSNLFYLRFLNPGSGQVKAGFSVSKDGDVLIEGRTISEHEHASKTASTRVKQAALEAIRGNDTKSVGDTYSRTAKTIDRKAESGISDTAGSTYKLSAADISVTANHQSYEFVNGYRPEKDVPMIPGQVPAKTIHAVYGNIDLKAGSLLDAVTGPTLWPSINMNTYYGDINMNANVAGSIIMQASALPSISGTTVGAGIVLNSPLVILGGVPGQLIPVVSPGMAACKYEALLAYVTALHVALASHIHPTMVGPSGPSADLATALTSVVTPLVAPIMSLSVRLAT